MVLWRWRSNSASSVLDRVFHPMALALQVLPIEIDSDSPGVREEPIENGFDSCLFAGKPAPTSINGFGYQRR